MFVLLDRTYYSTKVLRVFFTRHADAFGPRSSGFFEDGFENPEPPSCLRGEYIGFRVVDISV